MAEKLADRFIHASPRRSDYSMAYAFPSIVGLGLRVRYARQRIGPSATDDAPFIPATRFFWFYRARLFLPNVLLEPVPSLLA